MKQRQQCTIIPCRWTMARNWLVMSTAFTYGIVSFIRPYGVIGIATFQPSCTCPNIDFTDPDVLQLVNDKTCKTVARRDSLKHRLALCRPIISCQITSLRRPMHVTCACTLSALLCASWWSVVIGLYAITAERNVNLNVLWIFCLVDVTIDLTRICPMFTMSYGLFSEL